MTRDIEFDDDVYIFGGQTPNGKLSNELWKGQLNGNRVKWTRGTVISSQCTQKDWYMYKLLLL